MSDPGGSVRVDARDLCVGVDIGTTSVKAVAVDDDGRVVARARIPHPLRVPTPEHLEHDADRAWRRGPAKAIAALRLDGDPLAVNVSAMVPSMTAVDGRGRPCTPGLLYGDARGRTRSAATPAGSGEAVEFLRWCAREAPGARGYWPAPTVANHALGRCAVLDSSTAFSCHPLYGLEGWDLDLVARCGVRPDQLPEVVGTGQPCGRITGTDTVLAAGAIDAMGEQIVAGADAVGDVLLILGTTLICWVVVPEWTDAPPLWTIPAFVDGNALVGGPSNAGGLFLEWALRLFGRPRAGESCPPDAVPVFSPYIRGERVPLHDPDRRATLARLDLTHGPAACRRAAYEASGFAARHIIDLARRHAGAQPARVVATGGGTRVDPWVRAVADCTGLPVDVVSVPEGGALGSAWFARMAAGRETSMADAARWARVARRVEPDPDWAAACDARYHSYVELAEEAR